MLELLSEPVLDSMHGFERTYLTCRMWCMVYLCCLPFLLHSASPVVKEEVELATWGLPEI